MSAVDELLTAFRDYLLSRSDLLLRHFIEGFRWPAEERLLAAHDLPVVAYLRELERPVNGAEGALFNELSNAVDMLHWAQTYSITDFGADFLQRYGWVELFGTRGHFASDEMAGGFLLLGPGVHYPDHHHEAEEIYIPLTDGSLWSKDAQPFLPRWSGEIIHHPSNIRHAMRTEDQPLVALYLWRGGPLAQKSIISGRMQ
ncbi:MULTISPECIES: dimethylsulfonioproprionate lyase family protein [unclassified Rhizobium]|uniref:dimethylsulfonioproprionate lyase family protein n=1 Tax=unclassified Rhizobium TaxID=2613769 RepID=UPI000EAA24F5|nr:MULTISPECIES: dimethylsulfonioproprionate lyase family protein [unclassified Rhizobium]AYG66553.1 transcriptional regulator [Rhizobium sp. CCGE531]AYG72934.1 transcriptional regulator [Rhizobium sp. CCGE532]